MHLMQGATCTTSEAPVSLLDVLRTRETQARAHGASYLAPVPDQDSMLFWITQAATSARKAAERKQVHVAASADVDQSTIARFERGDAWPRRTDSIIDAYASDLDIDSIQVWEEALKLWKAHREGAELDTADIIEDLVEVREASAETGDGPTATDTSKRSSSAGRKPARSRGTRRA